MASVTVRVGKIRIEARGETPVQMASRTKIEIPKESEWPSSTITFKRLRPEMEILSV